MNTPRRPPTERLDRIAGPLPTPGSVPAADDLLDGTDVTDDPDTLPGELFEERFAQGKEAPSKPQD